MKKKRSKNEEIFEKFLIDNNIRYEYEAKINAPFTERLYHKVDFYLPDYDLYIEIKGFMTYWSINVLRYLLNNSGHNFYVLQMTESDWIEKYNKKIHKTNTNKCALNNSIQFNEILELTKGNITPEQLSQISSKRIDDYINLRNNDIDNWLEIEKSDEYINKVK